MNRNHLGWTVFFGGCFLSALIGWLSGYDFDHRSPEVALCSFMTVAISGIAGLVTATAPV